MSRIKISDIKESDLPLICLVDDRRGFMSWIIKAHSRGNYNHIQELHKLTHFASQDFKGFREVPIEKYLKPHITLKFWKPILDKNEKQLWKDCIGLELQESWWKRRYDFIGLLGQLLPFRWTRKLNNSWTRYCSERVRERIITILEVFGPRHSTPSEWNQLFKGVKEMELFGYIIED